MELKNIHNLNSMTRNFYAKNAASFSETRQSAWPGWTKIIDSSIRMLNLKPKPPVLRLLDVGCGNLRFEHTLAKNENITSRGNIEAWCIDITDELVEANQYTENEACSINFIRTDVCEELERNSSVSSLMQVPECDLCVSFALMHHIPLYEWRVQLLADILQKTAPGGMAAVSFWQFLNSPRIAEKAASITSYANKYLKLGLDMSEGDFMLGWQDSVDTLRYCHHCDEDEINMIAKDAMARVPGLFDLHCFSEDGHTRNLNRYTIFERHA